MRLYSLDLMQMAVALDHRCWPDKHREGCDGLRILSHIVNGNQLAIAMNISL